MKTAGTEPIIVCLCGSTRFKQAFIDAQLAETLKGKIVLSVGCYTQSDEELKSVVTPEVKKRLDSLHLKKIDMADEVLFLNVDNYLGESTRRELIHAARCGKTIRFWTEEKENR